MSHLCKKYKLANDNEYRHTVAMAAAAYAAKGHKVLVVSDRVHFLKACAELAGEDAICITGEVAHEDREECLSEIRNGRKTFYLELKQSFPKASQ